jgi:hypothetical protein
MISILNVFKMIILLAGSFPYGNLKLLLVKKHKLALTARKSPWQAPKLLTAYKTGN